MRAESWSLLASCVLLLRTIPQLGETAAPTDEERVRLRILSLLPTSSHEEQGPLPLPSYDQGLLSAMATAVRHVNEREDLLAGYELEAVVDNGGCSDSVSAVRFSFVKQVFGRRKGDIIGIVGPILCPESALAVADLAARRPVSLVNIHLASSFSVETNHRQYSFSMLGPASDLLATLVAFTKHTGWRRLYVLYETDSSFYDRLYREFLASVEGLETEVMGVSEMGTIPDALSAVQSSGYRVVLLLTGELLASHTLCMANHGIGLTFPDYQFVLVGIGVADIESPNETRKEAGTCGCSHDSYEGTVLMHYEVISSQTTHPQYASDKVGEVVSSTSVLGPLLYDSVWALALALNSSIETLEKRGIFLADYRHGMPETTKTVEQELFQLQFQGISGTVDFRREDGFARRDVQVTQVVLGGEDTAVLFAEYSGGNFTVLASNASWTIIEDRFPKWSPSIHIAGSVVFFTVLLIHLAVLVTIHVATVVYRDNSWVKASSNRMNQFNIAGNYLLFLGLAFHNIIHTFSDSLSHKAIGVLCQATWPWVISIGSTLITGSLALKTWRLYRIFIHYLNPGRTVSDRMLSFFLFLLVGIDIVIATVWTAIDPITPRVVSERVVSRDGRILVQQSIMCASDSIPIWLVLIMLYKILQIGALLTLTILTRKINDKKYTTLNLRIASYTFSFTVGFGFTLFYFLFFVSGDSIADDIVLNLVLNSIVLQNILLVLLPPLFPVLKSKLSRTEKTTL